MSNVRNFILLVLLFSACSSRLDYKGGKDIRLTASSTGVPDNFVQKHSKRVEKKIVSLIQKRFESLATKTPDSKVKDFQRGRLFLNSLGLVWQERKGVKHILVSSNGLPEGHGISQFVISPDSSKVAYATTFHGQDLKHWNVVSINEKPRLLTKRAAFNRMSDFNWNKNSNGFYYSFFNKKEDVNNGRKPICEGRFRNLDTGKDELIHNHGLAENFAIADIDGGKTLVAYRLLNPGSGIKTTFSMYKGIKNKNGKYIWKKAYPRNKFVGVFLGVLNKKVLILTSEVGSTYGIVGIDILNNNERRVVVKAKKKEVLHLAELTGSQLILQYHSIPKQNVSLRIIDLKNKKSRLFSIGKNFNLTPYGNLTRFLFQPGGKVSRAVYSDVFRGNHVLELNLNKGKIRVLKNDKDLNFDFSRVEQSFFSFKSSDGTRLTGRIYRRKGERPSFAFIRQYGWISIKNSPEPREVQMALEINGAYITIDLPGGGERGAKWFLSGSRYRLKTARYISETSDFLQKKLNMGPKRMVVLGRSWGGYNSLMLAAKYGHNFGIINSIVPIINIQDMLANGWFGRIAHSDFAPLIDRRGNYILDRKFYNYLKGTDPTTLIPEIPRGLRLHLLTNGLDDRVDQGGELESNFAYRLSKRLKKKNLMYHRSIKGNHANRFYQVLVFSLIADFYKLPYRPLISE